MSTFHMIWNLQQRVTNITIERYCHNCKKKVPFLDSGILRHNANGKNIYQFAIYKCPNGHTWNRKLDMYKAKTEISMDETKTEMNEHQPQAFSLLSLHKTGIKKVVISLEDVEGKWRLDALLSQHIEDVSRSQIVQLIKEGKIVVDETAVKPKHFLRKNETITIIEKI